MVRPARDDRYWTLAETVVAAVSGSRSLRSGDTAWSVSCSVDSGASLMWVQAMMSLSGSNAADEAVDGGSSWPDISRVSLSGGAVAIDVVVFRLRLQHSTEALCRARVHCRSSVDVGER